MGSGRYLQRGSQEPSVVLENSLESSDVPPIPVSLGQGGERGIAKWSPTAGSDRAGTKQLGESLAQTRT